MTELSLVPAGAGAGKTYHIQKTLADWVQQGLVAPGRILAVTFTEAAASELRERVRAELMDRGRIDDALDIDHAYMGTIHALGQRLLTEHAFAAGRAPDARLLSEPERDLLIRREIAHSRALAPLMADLERFGYRWDFLSGDSAEDRFRADVLKTIDLIRGLGERGTEPGILEPALAALSEGYGPSAADGAALTGALRRAVEALLAAFPETLASLFDGNATAIRDFSRNHNDLRRALRDGTLDRDWALWQRLRNLRLSNTRTRTPDGYDDLARAVIAAADALPRHPGPLEDARTHLAALVRGAQGVLGAYQEAKRRAGLIDYADMIVETEALLRNRPEILAAVTNEIDCVVIDEFQDTNPVQFALLWRLARKARRALIVGDTKQSIMGFQGADPRLSEALLDTYPDVIAPLDRNWRSDPRIMDFVNVLGPRLFPEGYVALAPQRPPGEACAIEAIELPGGRKDTTPDSVANRIADLLDEGVQIPDKSSGKTRPLRPADIAVLCYTNPKCSAVAAALEARGLPVRIRQEGWLTAPAMRAARAALAFAADPGDRHAALTWLTLGPPAMPLRDALASAADGVLDTVTALDPLRALQGLTDMRPVADCVAAVLTAGGLHDWAAGLAGADQAVADLARLEAEALDFDAMATDLRAAAGFHGCGVQIFLGWIRAQTEKAWDRHPDPDGWSGTGIEVVTWHSAKGREWPVTVVAGLDQKIAERPGTLQAVFDHFDDLDEVLGHARLSLLPDFAAPESQEPFTLARRPDDEREAARALYVALTRARDRLILAVPPDKATRTTTERMVDLLRDRAGLATSPGALIACDRHFDARVTAGHAEEPAIPADRGADIHAMFGQPRAARAVTATPWRRSPSSLEAGTLPPGLVLTSLPFGPPVTESRAVNAADRGTAWHLAFRVLWNRPELAERVPAATGLSHLTCAEIAAQADALRGWLADQGYHRMRFELPLQQIAADGSETNAIVDLLAEGEAGLLIVDHKSGPCPNPLARFAGYRPQLMAYARMVRAAWPDRPLRGVAINWMSEGLLTVEEAGADAGPPEWAGLSASGTVPARG